MYFIDLRLLISYIRYMYWGVGPILSFYSPQSCCSRIRDISASPLSYLRFAGTLAMLWLRHLTVGTVGHWGTMVILVGCLPVYLLCVTQRDVIAVTSWLVGGIEITRDSDILTLGLCLVEKPVFFSPHTVCLYRAYQWHCHYTGGMASHNIPLSWTVKIICHNPIFIAYNI